ncbi:MAG TPA: DUF4383 domain-containing protein [Solirubrobacterales bacterium]|nr:DUF4383 domain-containing protein [Solirubrobacterales bacterium]
MERTAYARLYATVAGAVLVLLGFGGLLVNTEFRAPELTSDLFGFYTVNGWANVLYVGAGLIGLFLARPLPRLFALIAGLLFTGLAIWGILATNGTLLFDRLPALRWVNLFNLLLGLCGLAAYVASRWDRISAWAGGLGGKFEARTEARRQKRRRKQIRKRRSVAKTSGR